MLKIFGKKKKSLKQKMLDGDITLDEAYTEMTSLLVLGAIKCLLDRAQVFSELKELADDSNRISEHIEGKFGYTYSFRSAWYYLAIKDLALLVCDGNFGAFGVVYRLLSETCSLSYTTIPMLVEKYLTPSIISDQLFEKTRDKKSNWCYADEFAKLGDIGKVYEPDMESVSAIILAIDKAYEMSEYNKKATPEERKPLFDDYMALIDEDGVRTEGKGGKYAPHFESYRHFNYYSTTGTASEIPITGKHYIIDDEHDFYIDTHYFSDSETFDEQLKFLREADYYETIEKNFSLWAKEHQYNIPKIMHTEPFYYKYFFDQESSYYKVMGREDAPLFFLDIE